MKSSVDGLCLRDICVNGAQPLGLASDTILVVPDCPASDLDLLLSILGLCSGGWKTQRLNYLLHPQPLHAN